MSIHRELKPGISVVLGDQTFVAAKLPSGFFEDLQDGVYAEQANSKDAKSQMNFTREIIARAIRRNHPDFDVQLLREHLDIDETMELMAQIMEHTLPKGQTPALNRLMKQMSDSSLPASQSAQATPESTPVASTSSTSQN